MAAAHLTPAMKQLLQETTNKLVKVQITYTCTCNVIAMKENDIEQKSGTNINTNNTTKSRSALAHYNTYPYYTILLT